jgi:hypothetical protein
MRPGISSENARRTFAQLSGTPKRITLLRPFLTSGPMNSSRRSTPQRHWPGSEAISTRAVGSSVMKIGYMSIDLSIFLRVCHSRESGWL